MNFWKFLVDYWKILLAALFMILSFVFALIRKKPIANILDKELVDILYYIPKWICESEDKYGAGHGVEKKAYVMSLICDYLKHSLSLTESDLNTWLLILGQEVEKILSTPQKHERQIGKK